MEYTKMTDVTKMLADAMENGLLDNIVDMFKHDKGLYEYVDDLMTDERMRVRIGTTALLECLRKDDPENITKASPCILPLLKDRNPVIRGDAAYALGLIGDKNAIPFLEEITGDADENVGIIAKEAIEDILSTTESI